MKKDKKNKICPLCGDTIEKNDVWILDDDNSGNRVHLHCSIKQLEEGDINREIGDK